MNSPKKQIVHQVFWNTYRHNTYMYAKGVVGFLRTPDAQPYGFTNFEDGLSTLICCTKCPNPGKRVGRMMLFSSSVSSTSTSPFLRKKDRCITPWELRSWGWAYATRDCMLPLWRWAGRSGLFRLDQTKANANHLTLSSISQATLLQRS